MSDKQSCLINEVYLEDFGKASSDLVILDLKEMFKKHSHLLNNPHRIHYYQLLLLNKAGGYLYVDSQKCNLKPNSILAQAKGNVEYFKHIGNKNENSGYALMFTEEYLYKYPNDLAWIGSLKLFDILTLPFLIKFSPEEFSGLEVFIKELSAELNTENSFASDEILINLFKTFLLTLERIKRTEINEELIEVQESSIIPEFKNKLEENYCHSRSVRFYADLLNITPKKLNLVIQEYNGTSAKKIIEERVLMETKRLLMYTNQSVKEIGFSMGFTDPTNFNKFFKKNTKTTPAEFRTRHRK